MDENTWTQHTWRQQQYPVHRHTQMIPLMYDADFRFSGPTKHPQFFELEREIQELLDTVTAAYHHKGYPLRLLLTRLSPKSEIKPHKDTGPTLRYVHRIHIPIKTNPLVTFDVGDEKMLLKEGEIWEINNCRIHSVNNAGTEFRVHLILDWVTKDLAQSYLSEQFNLKTSRITAEKNSK